APKQREAAAPGAAPAAAVAPTAAERFDSLFAPSGSGEGAPAEEGDLPPADEAALEGDVYEQPAEAPPVDEIPAPEVAADHHAEISAETPAPSHVHEGEPPAEGAVQEAPASQATE